MTKDLFAPDLSTSVFPVRSAYRRSASFGDETELTGSFRPKRRVRFAVRNEQILIPSKCGRFTPPPVPKPKQCREKQRERLADLKKELSIEKLLLSHSKHQVRQLRKEEKEIHSLRMLERLGKANEAATADNDKTDLTASSTTTTTTTTKQTASILKYDSDSSTSNLSRNRRRRRRHDVAQEKDQSVLEKLQSQKLKVKSIQEMIQQIQKELETEDDDRKEPGVITITTDNNIGHESKTRTDCARPKRKQTSMQKKKRNKKPSSSTMPSGAAASALSTSTSDPAPQRPPVKKEQNSSSTSLSPKQTGPRPPLSPRLSALRSMQTPGTQWAKCA